MTISHNLSFPYRPEEHHVTTLSDDFLNALVAEIDSDDIVGITLAGSHIRAKRPHIATLTRRAGCQIQ